MCVCFGCGGRGCMHSYVVSIFQDQNFTRTVRNPCAPRGSVVNVSHADIFTSPCVTGPDSVFAFGHKIHPPSDNMVNCSSIYPYPSSYLCYKTYPLSDNIINHRSVLLYLSSNGCFTNLLRIGISCIASVHLHFMHGQHAFTFH